MLEIGKAYSVEDLVSIMLMNSDNGAKNLLLTLTDRNYIKQLFSIVSLVNPETTKALTISSREYALFFRVLYGSSYLNEEHSERILSLLSQSTFKDGLVAGLPEGTPVAHKFGTYEFDETIDGKVRSAQQLHDCGVVYHKENPYIFCLMTKGKDTNTLFKVISHVSKLVYDYQDTKE
jgi:beta-lactamase class A